MLKRPIKPFLMFLTFLFLLLLNAGTGWSAEPASPSVPDPVIRLGPVYEISEPDWSQALPGSRPAGNQRRLTAAQLREAFGRQSPPIELPEVESPRRYTVDPSVRISRPITDHNGRIVAPAGSRMNPLRRLPSFQKIAIIDGRKEKQVNWAKEMQFEIVLLAAGDVVAVGESLGRRVYPLPPALVAQYAIERIPVVLSAEGDLIQVEEVPLP